MKPVTEHQPPDPNRTQRIALPTTAGRDGHDPTALTLPAGTRFGRYYLLRQLGAGGMSVVYLAEQTEPVHRQVAIKVIAQRRIDGEQLARFDLERQALARMNHPGIAQILDAGTTVEGWPYFVMEHVDGQPLDRWLATTRPDLDTRVRLLRDTCLAVAHAHQKGVLHCDLKPSNLLITQVDDQAHVKLIDFGIARAIDAGAGGGRAGTPGYISPEQARPGQDLDTRSDVFGLGALLYETISDRRLRPWADALDLVAASARISQDGDRDAPGPDAFGRGVRRRELAAICRRALVHDREERYDGPQSMAADLQRWLQQQPVSAHGGSVVYRLGCFTRRHTGMALVSLAAVLVTVALIWRLIVELDSTRRERDTASQIADVLTDTFRSADPHLHPGGSMTVRELLRRRGAEIRDQPMAAQVRLRVLSSLAEVQDRLELFDDAIDTWALAMDVATAARLDSLVYALPHARALVNAERWQPAQTALEGLIAELRSRNDRRHLAEALVLQAELHDYTGELRFGEQALQEAQPLLDSSGDVETRILWLRVHGRLADARGEFDIAVQALQQALDLSRAHWGENDLRTLTTLSDLAVAIGRTGDLERDEQLRRQVATATETIWGEDSPGLAIALDNLALAVRRRGDADALREAEALSRRALAIHRGHLGERSMNTAITINNLANILTAQERYDEADTLHATAVATLSDILGEHHPSTAIVMHNHARNLVLVGRLDEARPLLQRSGQILLDSFGTEHPRYAIWQVTQAEYLIANDDAQTASPLLDAAEPVLTGSAQNLPELRRLETARNRLATASAASPAR